VTKYICPMHPEVSQDKSGICSKCKMGLVKQKEHSSHEDHDKHAGHSVSMFKNKFWLSLAMTIPVLAYSASIQEWLNFSSPEFTGSEYIPFIFSTAIFFYGGLVFIKSALSELQVKMPGMMTLISMAIVTAYLYSIATQFFIAGDTFFWELATLVTIMLLGHWLEMSAIAKAENALDAISELLPDEAEKIIDGKPETVKVSELSVGDVVLVRPGSNIPVDGKIVEGSSSVDEAAISGESKPITKSVNDEVVAGTVNQDGSLKVEVSKLGDDTALAGIMRLVSEAQNSKSKTQVLADKAAFGLTIIALIAAVVTFAVWFTLNGAGYALERSVTVLIIACPHALGLAIPLVVSISTTLSARNGLLVRKRLALEVAREIDMVLFDKTGTLTKGEHGVTDVWGTKGYKEKEIVSLAASLEQSSEHIVGKGIVQYADEQSIKTQKTSDFSAIPGYGVRAKIGKETYLAVSYSYINEKDLAIPNDIKDKVRGSAKEGKTEVYLVKGNEVIGAIALADIIRDEAKVAIKSLKSMNIQTAMITGDSKEVATYVAKQLGLDTYFADVKPEDKANEVKKQQQNGKKVAMVGDGVNDAPALSQADIGVAIGAGTDVAIKSADIILVKSNPIDVVKIVKLSKATYKKMVQNLIWAAGYNVLVIPLAAGVLFSVGVVVAPALGAAIMSISTIVVALNAQLLRRADLSS